MDKYWFNFYNQNEPPVKHTSFAEWIEIYFIDIIKKRDLKLLDLGAGNGRDTKWFDKGQFQAYGIDKNYGEILEKDIKSGIVYRLDFKEILDNEFFKDSDIVYSRFFLHSISNGEIKKIVDFSKKYFVAEFRIKGDEPIIYTDHKRNFIDIGWLTNLLISNGFQILKMKVGRNMARYKNEDPLVARIIAKRW